MISSINIGGTPPSEPCVSVSDKEDYLPKMRKECVIFIAFLRRTLGNEPPGAQLFIKSNPHDFGTYLSVDCKFDDQNQEAVEYAYKCESDCPEQWDTIAKDQLREAGIDHQGKG